ncbi:hypothetical protein WA026_018537 [Henosepilachna vigintioctopunctata]|uniref:UDP-glucuronosyltransferase n=1 Tax=Henosepilachna vigintioctopunctata TaxID=420089 RepID=A0AAW1UDU0_9CUCU
MFIKCIILGLMTFTITEIEGGKILAIFWTPSRSHQISGGVLLKNLARKGHEVHLLTSFVEDDVNDIPTYKQELLTGIKGFFSNQTNTDSFKINRFFEVLSAFDTMVNRFWQNEPVQKLIKTKPKYDAIIIVTFFSDFVLSLSHLLGAPSIILSTIGSNVMVDKYVANPNMPYASNVMIPYPQDTFLGRLITIGSTAFISIFVKYVLNPLQDRATRKYLPDAPSLDVLNKNVSLVLASSHFSIESPKPYVPNMIQIGGFHIEEPKQLPDNLREYLDNASDGAILFSVGTMVKLSEHLKPEKLESIIRGLGRVAPLKVLFKSNLPIPNTPKNVMVVDWMPQSDVLAHPNIRLFISHGGLGGTTEAVYHGVPILGIPFFADQHGNIASAVNSGYALKLNIKTFTEDEFVNAITELLTNPKYTINVKKRSSILKTHPVKPLDNAIWWIEHIIEHKGGEHLRNTGMDLEWYQLYMVDIMLFFLILSSIFFLVSFFMTRFIVKKVWNICLGNIKKKLIEKISDGLFS